MAPPGAELKNDWKQEDKMPPDQLTVLETFRFEPCAAAKFACPTYGRRR